MSYCVGIHIHQLKENEDALEFIAKFQALALDNKNLKQFIDYNDTWLCNAYRECRKFDLTDGMLSNNFLYDTFLGSIFNYSFCYWKDKHLVGLLSNRSDLPGNLSNLFDGYVIFQNRAETDYSYESWNCLGSWVTEYITWAQTLSAKEAYEKYFNKKISALDIQQLAKQGIILDAKQEDFLKKSLVYNYIEKELDILNLIENTSKKAVLIETGKDCSSDNFFEKSIYITKELEQRYRQQNKYKKTAF